MKRAFGLIALATLAACEPGAKESVQVGYRGVGQEINYDRSKLKEIAAANVAPPPLAPASVPSPPANWQNVQVLTDVSANEMNRTMLAMTNWVSPKEGCNYCHNPANFASDEKYQKVASRRMLEMTRYINNEYKSHVQGTGVTCYSCHRGNNVPQYGLWSFTNEDQWQRAYLDRPDVRVQSLGVKPTNVNRSSIKQTENTYALMIDVSSALGVNCTYCHNSRAWASWQNAPPARITGMYGFRMVRDINSTYVASLNTTLPATRLGVHKDAPKVSCMTCHQGAYKPLLGAQMAKDYPGLWGATSWTRGGAGDTVSKGFIDLRKADSTASDGAPILKPEFAHPLPAPVRTKAGGN
ncbi:MAG: photosynthetic reaction center cytochrome c subunit [Phycisphaerae bacterium]|nr:photosynthetic reaction center cytochrome c subunit [Gemmatimonadaceae bacterium]